MSSPKQPSVVVVGGSLVGLSTALFLAHWKVPVILLERHLGSSPHPRAVGYTTRTIELLRTVSLDDKIPSVQWKGGPPRRVSVKSLAGEWQQEQAWSVQKGGPGPKQGPGGGGPPPNFSAFSPVNGVATSQDKIEPVLRQKAIELGADLRLGYKVTSVAQDDDGVHVKAIEASSGNEVTIDAAYLVACDGARSPIREQLGIKRSGVGFIRTIRSILFRCPPIDKYLERGFAQFQVEGREDGFEAFITTYGEKRWAVMWHDETGPEMDEGTQRDYIRKAVGLDIPDDDISLITTAQWDIGGHIADQFSSGRIFLAGDAAHALPPNRGGYGANTGIADAHNISWKLASVLSGYSKPALLSTYDEERRPIAQVRHDQIFLRDDFRRYVEDREWPGKHAEMLGDIDLELGQLYRSSGFVDIKTADLPLAKSPLGWKGQPGSRAPHVALKSDGEKTSTLDFFGQHWVVMSLSNPWKIAAEHAATRTGVGCQAVQVGDDVEEEEKGRFADIYGLGPDNAVLVRPDGFIAWKSQDNETGDASAALTKALARASFAMKQ